jgi:cell wall-associated NlpC family hydrolase
MQMHFNLLVRFTNKCIDLGKEEKAQMKKSKKIVKVGVTLSAFLVTVAMLTEMPAFLSCSENSKEKVTETIVKKEKNLINVNKTESENAVVFSCGVNGKNEPGFIPANEGEEITADTFYVSGDTVFLDDTTGARILVYKHGKYNKTLKLEWNQNVVRMYYSPETDVLSMVYLDLNKTDASYYYFMQMKVSTEQILENKQLSDKNRVLLEYYFDADGELQMEYLKEESTIEDDELEEELNDILDDSFEYEACYSDKKNTTTICSNYKEGTDEVNECIINSSADTPETYAIPEAHNSGLDAENIQVEDKKIYQMVANEEGITVYELKQKNIKNDTVETYNRDRNAENTEKKLTFLNKVQDSNNDGKIISTSTSVSPLSYATIKSRIEDRYSLKWRYAPKNRNIKVVAEAKRKYVAAPGWLIAQYPNPTSTYSVENIPYCWGGYTSNFKTQIEQGYYAGNVNTTASSYIEKTAGLDCSGFVSIVYKLPGHFGTYQLASSKYFAKRSNTSNVKKYDLLINPGSHVVIVTRVYMDGNDKYVDTAEESGTYGKIVKRTGRRYNTLCNDNYSPYNYTNIKN